MRPVARIAQSVEQGIENPRVGGSIPSPGTTNTEKPQAKLNSLGFFLARVLSRQTFAPDEHPRQKYSTTTPMCAPANLCTRANARILSWRDSQLCRCDKPPQRNHLAPIAAWRAKNRYASLIPHKDAHLPAGAHPNNKRTPHGRGHARAGNSQPAQALR
jgi:hypothetical protein